MTSRSAPTFQFTQLKFKSLTYVFLLADFVYISYLTHLAITSLVIFAELCILLCSEVFVLKFSIFVSFFSAILFVLAQF